MFENNYEDLIEIDERKLIIFSGEHLALRRFYRKWIIGEKYTKFIPEFIHLLIN